VSCERREVEGGREGGSWFAGEERESWGVICFIELLCDTVDGLATGQSPSLYTFYFHMLF